MIPSFPFWKPLKKPLFIRSTNSLAFKASFQTFHHHYDKTLHKKFLQGNENVSKKFSEIILRK